MPITGSAIGNITQQNETYVEGAPYIYVQDYRAAPLFNPDSDGYYWGMSGTTLYPAFLLGCVQNVKWSEDVTLNMVRCDTVGDKAAIQKRNFLEVTFDLQSVFPFGILSSLIKGNLPTTGSGKEKMGIGTINNNQYWMLYMPKVYDEVNGYWLMGQFHRVQFTGKFTWDWQYGNNLKITGLNARAMYDSTKPANQAFATLAHFDASLLP